MRGLANRASCIAVWNDPFGWTWIHFFQPVFVYNVVLSLIMYPHLRGRCNLINSCYPFNGIQSAVSRSLPRDLIEPQIWWFLIEWFIGKLEAILNQNFEFRKVRTEKEKTNRTDWTIQAKIRLKIVQTVTNPQGIQTYFGLFTICAVTRIMP